MGTFLHPIRVLVGRWRPSRDCRRARRIVASKRSLKLADGRVGERRIGRVLAKIDGVREEILCVFADDGDLPTIGAHMLEAFLLAVDTVDRRLVPAEALWA